MILAWVYVPLMSDLISVTLSLGHPVRGNSPSTMFGLERTMYLKRKERIIWGGGGLL